MKRPIPKLLDYHYRNSSLLFLGCSLNDDRTMRVFAAAKRALGDEEIPQHFSIEQAPDTEADLVERNHYLTSLGITPIWFEPGCFELVEGILRQAKNELSHRGVFPDLGHASASQPEPPPLVEAAEFSRYLGDFVDLMPLLYWFHRHVPQTDTRRYLSAMQCVFYAYSLFTDEVDRDLTEGLDHLLRAISVNPEFDDYSHGKLSIAFAHFQQFLQSHGCDNHAQTQFEWNMREMLNIASGQFHALSAGGMDLPELDEHAIRLIVALLHHGKNQLRSPDAYCELPESVNHELSDFLAISLTRKLGVIVPDRLDPILNEDIRGLCESAWNDFDRVVEPGFVDRVRILLTRFWQ